MKKIILTLLGLLLFTNVAVSQTADLQLAKIKKNRFYFCNQETRTVSIKDLNEQGQELSSKVLSNAALKKKRSQLVKQNANLKTQILSESKKAKKVRLQERFKNNNDLRKKLTGCQRGSLPTRPPAPAELDTLPPDLVLPEQMNENKILTGTIPGNCTITGKNIEPYQDGTDDRIRTAESGQINCVLTQGVAENQNLLLKVTRAGQPRVILFSERVLPEQIKNNKFALVLCKEFPGCFYARRLAQNVAAGGVDIVLEELVE